MWKSMNAYVVLTALILTSGCSSVAASSCDGFRWISVLPEDKQVISRDLKLQIAGHNQFGSETCGWKNPAED